MRVQRESYPRVLSVMLYDYIQVTCAGLVLNAHPWFVQESVMRVHSPIIIASIARLN